MIEQQSEFIQEIKNVDKQANYRIGTVVGLFSSPSGTAKIKFDGEIIASEKQYSYLSTYKPVVNDRVLLAYVSGTYVILGKILFNVSPPSSGSMSVSGSLTVNGQTNLNNSTYIYDTLSVSGKVSTNGEVQIGGNLNHDGSYIGFFGTSPTYKRTAYYANSDSVTRQRLNELIQILANYGLVTPSN